MSEASEKPQYISSKGKMAMDRYNEFAIFRSNLIMLKAFKNVSCEELAKEITAARPKRVWDWENGRCHPSFDEIRKIAKYFDVTLDQLLYKKATVSFETINN